MRALKLMIAYPISYKTSFKATKIIRDIKVYNLKCPFGKNAGRDHEALEDILAYFSGHFRLPDGHHIISSAIETVRSPSILTKLPISLSYHP